jgi:hypothetical protein
MNLNKLIIIWVAIFAIVGTPLAYASEKSAYESGRDHGCDDADLPPSDRYINEPGKGKSRHTQEFNSGYDAGFSNCGGGGSGNSGSGSSSGGSESRENLGSKLCRLIDTNRAAATALAYALGYPGLDQAVSALCGITGNN